MVYLRLKKDQILGFTYKKYGPYTQEYDVDKLDLDFSKFEYFFKNGEVISKPRLRDK